MKIVAEYRILSDTLRKSTRVLRIDDKSHADIVMIEEQVLNGQLHRIPITTTIGALTIRESDR